MLKNGGLKRSKQVRKSLFIFGLRGCYYLAVISVTVPKLDKCSLRMKPALAFLVTFLILLKIYPSAALPRTRLALYQLDSLAWCRLGWPFVPYYKSVLSRVPN